MKINVITRYGPPSKLDHAEQGTVCLVAKDDGYDEYLQTSSQEDDPSWEFIGFSKKEDGPDISAGPL